MTGQTAYFFVDEAGDLTLFGRRGKSLLGNQRGPVCSVEKLA